MSNIQTAFHCISMVYLSYLSRYSDIGFGCCILQWQKVGGDESVGLQWQKVDRGFPIVAEGGEYGLWMMVIFLVLKDTLVSSIYLLYFNIKLCVEGVLDNLMAGLFMDTDLDLTLFTRLSDILALNAHGL